MKMKYPETAKRITHAMNSIGLSQQELSDRSRVGKSSISHYVNGSNVPGNKAAYAMANVLRVNPLWLMGLDANMLPDNYSRATMELTDTEEQMIYAYRNASVEIQKAARAVLDVKERPMRTPIVVNID